MRHDFSEPRSCAPAPGADGCSWREATRAGTEEVEALLLSVSAHCLFKVVLKIVLMKAESFFVCQINLDHSGSPCKHAINVQKNPSLADRCVVLSWQMTILCSKHVFCEAALFCEACTFTRLSTRDGSYHTLGKRTNGCFFGLLSSVEAALKLRTANDTTGSQVTHIGSPENCDSFL